MDEMTMAGWTMADALEASFGGYRLRVDGNDIRGFFTEAAAIQAAAAAQEWHPDRRYSIYDTRLRPEY